MEERGWCNQLKLWGYVSTLGDIFRGLNVSILRALWLYIFQWKQKCIKIRNFRNAGSNSAIVIVVFFQVWNYTRYGVWYVIWRCSPHLSPLHGGAKLVLYIRTLSGWFKLKFWKGSKFRWFILRLVLITFGEKRNR